MTDAQVKVEDLEIRLLLDALYYRFHYDFRNYAMSSIRRRLRQARVDMGCATISALQEKVLHDADMLPQMLRYLTVQVSEMFRDPGYFKAIREHVVPHLRTYPSLKVWVAGCSTGEELYSLVILFREAGLEERTLFYATDINPDALARAQAGVYDLERVRKFTENHRLSGGDTSLSDYYHTGYDRCVLDKSLRRNVVFSDHSLVSDQVFGEMQFVSCRNVMIYFDRALQDRAIGLFRDALPRNAFLGLGAKETLRFSGHAAAFRDFVPAEKIYQRTGA
ncbi:chemotaxis protein methyltransferase CheR [Loktanella fryxellensis]|uniref:Chemotaxis protein methyltransferase CheR n=1 Tax=Loktanella fryxellensis TaxID=245187 RepID=A0A1H8CB79_9RHOB|nr:CheR family methyltransferase [Loktanella fryxellensis]SEM92276.1 chemotaxis protein methyltransferase CheR [Loktanella fryxellensis]